MTSARPHPVRAPTLGGIDHLEWWVGNARAFAGFLAAAFGFDLVAYAGPETGRRDRVSYLLAAGPRPLHGVRRAPPRQPDRRARPHATATASATSASSSTTSPAAYDAALARGAASLREPAKDEDDHGVIHHAAIRAYGDTVHTFLDRSAYTGPFAPQFEPTDLVRPVGPEVGITRFDHVVANVERGHLDEWVGYYEQVLGFDQLTHFDDEQISTEYSALMSTVVWNHDKVVLPINEPAEGRRKSQIEEYLDFYGAPGVQHIALHTPDIVAVGAGAAGPRRAVHGRARRVLRRGPRADGRASSCRGRRWPSSGILVDRDHEGHLLQIFTETLTDRPTVFFEIIQREGATGLRRGQLQGPLRVHRARPGPPRQPLNG